MTEINSKNAKGEHNSYSLDVQYQEDILQGVSRTFALTIPLLPDRLQLIVGNAYLLCRITDTIEDEPALTFEQKSYFSNYFVDAVAGKKSADKFALKLCRLLSDSSSKSEHDLIANSARVIRITQSFNQSEINSLHRCVKTMARGMAEFQQNPSLAGLKNLPEHNLYCYYVAGVVGEMLTELFCIHSTEANKNYDELMNLAVSFGQGLQMTNILKDQWEDRKRGACWLPRDIFESHNCELSAIQFEENTPGFTEGIIDLVKIAYGHLISALRYTLFIPPHETGIRNHCMTALSMAVLTLRNIHINPNFREGNEIKISRRSVWTVYYMSKIFVRSNWALKTIFRILAVGLPSPNIQSVNTFS